MNLTSLVAHFQVNDRALLDYIDLLEDHFDRLEPSLHAFLPEDGRFARLRREAVDLATRFPEPARRPPLYGVPVGVKDIFHVQGFITRAGSTLPPDLLQGDESATVAALKAAGALILGKTVTTEFAYFAPGPTRHPLSDTLGQDHTPGGSSSGSAAAVAAGLCPLALGTQTIGSIVRPAAFCGVVGFKPSYGRIPTVGVLPLAPSADTVGFFVPQAVDIAPVAAVLLDGWWAPERPLSLPVLGIPSGPYLERAPAATRMHLVGVAEHLRSAGYGVHDVPALPDFETIALRHNQLVAAELIERGRRVSNVDYEAALTSRMATRTALERRMGQAGVDMWLSPAALGPAPLGLDSTGDPIMNLPWTHAGLPVVSLPAGERDGLPVGIQLAGRFGADEALIEWATALGHGLGN